MNPNSSGFGRGLKRFFGAPIAAILAIRFWWRHGPISREEAERVDRICNPKKYLPEVDAPKPMID